VHSGVSRASAVVQHDRITTSSDMLKRGLPRKFSPALLGSSEVISEPRDDTSSGASPCSGLHSRQACGTRQASNGSDRNCTSLQGYWSQKRHFRLMSPGNTPAPLCFPDIFALSTTTTRAMPQRSPALSQFEFTLF